MKTNYSILLLALLIALSGVFTFATPTQAALADIQVCDDSLFAGGDGSEGDPYQISTSTELYNVTFCSDSLNQGNYFKLTSDIDLNGFENRYSGNDQAGWMPIGAYYDEDTYREGDFYGFFDGNYHVISGLNIDQRDQYYQGLFGLIRQGSVVENVGVVDANISGPQNMGIIAGNLDGIIRTSYVKNSVASSTDDDALGGMVAYLDSYGLIEDSYVYNVDIFGSRDSVLGGIAAAMSSEGQISRVYAQGVINLTDSESTGSIGGITGGWYGSTELEDSFSVAELSYEGTDDPYIGGLTAKWGEPSELGNNYWYNPEVGGVDACIGSATGYEGGFCTSVTDLSLFKDADNEPLASWDIATTDDSEFEGFNSGYPFLAWEKDGASAATTWAVFGVVDTVAPTLTTVTPIPSEVYIEDAKYYFNLSNPSEVEGEFLAEELISNDPTAEVIINPEEGYLTIGGIEVGYTYSTAFTFAYGSENTEILQVGPFTVIEREEDQPRRSGSRRRVVSEAGNSGNSVTPVVVASAQTSGNTTPTNSGTPSFARDLTIAFTGADVNKLQNILVAKDTGPAARALKANGTTQYFGPLTRAALAEYQAANGITPAIGYFGPKTRAQMQAAGL